MSLYNGFNNRQPQARSAMCSRPGLVEAVKSVKDLVDFARRDSWPVVFDPDDCFLVMNDKSDVDRFAPAGKVDGVFHQVEDCPLQVLPVSGDDAMSLRAAAQFNAVLRSQG